MLHISVLVMDILNTTESDIFIYYGYSFLPRDLTIQNLSMSYSGHDINTENFEGA